MYHAFDIISKKSFPNSKFSPMVPSESFITLDLTIMSIYFNCYVYCKVRSKFTLLQMCIQLSQQRVEKTTASIDINVRVYFYTLNSFPLIYICVALHLPHIFIIVIL